MSLNSSYKRFSASALLLLFTAMWSLKTAHVLLAHHKEEAKHLICESAHDPKSAHIHDERWAKEDCLLCAFLLSAKEPFALFILPDFLSKVPDSASPIYYFAPYYSKKACDAAMRRGPPVV